MPTLRSGGRAPESLNQLLVWGVKVCRRPFSRPTSFGPGVVVLLGRDSCSVSLAHRPVEATWLGACVPGSESSLPADAVARARGLQGGC